MSTYNFNRRSHDYTKLADNLSAAAFYTFGQAGFARRNACDTLADDLTDAATRLFADSEKVNQYAQRMQKT